MLVFIKKFLTALFSLFIRRDKITIRDAKSEDLDWLQELIVDGIKDGHYSQQPIAHTRIMLEQAIERNLILRYVNKNPMQYGGGGIKKECIMAWIDVLEKNGEKVGFCLSSQWKAASLDREILCISTVSNHRKQGIASLLVNYVIARHDSNTKFYARCKAESSDAFTMFLSYGFKHETTQPLGTRVLSYARNEAK